MTSTSASTVQSQPPKAVARAAVVTHGRPQAIGSAVARLSTVAREAGVELSMAPDEAAKHGVDLAEAEPVDLAVVLGGDGTMLRALARYLGTGIPVIGVNFGRVGFLTSIERQELESGLVRAFAGEYQVVELPTLDVHVGDDRHVAVNDLVVATAVTGRMVQLEWAIGGEALGRLGCDGLVCSTPPGSTGYNFSNGGPMLVWGLEAMAVTFVAPHALDPRPLVIPRGADLIVWNRTADVATAVLVDGHRVAELAPGGRVLARVGEQRSTLATLPEVTFFSRFRRTFAS
jgi:NAD+ kinase